MVKIVEWWQFGKKEGMYACLKNPKEPDSLSSH